MLLQVCSGPTSFSRAGREGGDSTERSCNHWTGVEVSLSPTNSGDFWQYTSKLFLNKGRNDVFFGGVTQGETFNPAKLKTGRASVRLRFGFCQRVQASLDHLAASFEVQPDKHNRFPIRITTQPFTAGTRLVHPVQMSTADV